MIVTDRTIDWTVIRDEALDTHAVRGIAGHRAHKLRAVRRAAATFTRVSCNVADGGLCGTSIRRARGHLALVVSAGKTFATSELQNVSTDRRAVLCGDTADSLVARLAATHDDQRNHQYVYDLIQAGYAQNCEVMRREVERLRRRLRTYCGEHRQPAHPPAPSAPAPSWRSACRDARTTQKPVLRCEPHGGHSKAASDG